MSDAETDAVATTPRAQYLSSTPDQHSPRDPLMTGVKARAGGWVSPSPALSPRNLKASAATVAAAGVLKGAALAAAGTGAAAADPAVAAALAAAAESLARVSPKPSRTTAAAAAAANGTGESTSQPAAIQETAQRSRPSLGTPLAAAAPSGPSSHHCSHPYPQSVSPGPCSIHTALPVNPTATTTAAAAAAAAAAAVSSRIVLGYTDASSRSSSNRSSSEASSATQPLLPPQGRPVTSPFAAVSAFTPLYGLSRSTSSAAAHMHAPGHGQAMPAAGPAARPAPTLQRPHFQPDNFDSSNPLGVAAPTPQPSAALRVAGWGRHSSAFRGMPLMQSSKVASTALEQLPEGAQLSSAIPPGVLQAAVLSNDGSCDSKDAFCVARSMLEPAPSAATTSTTAGGADLSTNPSIATGLGTTASLMSFGRFNSLPTLPTLATGMDSVDSFMCPATIVDFVVPVGSWKSSALHRASSCAEATSNEGSRRLSRQDPAGSSSNSISQWQGREGQLATRSSALPTSASMLFKRGSRGSNNGDPLALPVEAPSSSNSSSSTGAVGTGTSAPAAVIVDRSSSISSSQIFISQGSPVSPTAPSNIVKAASPEDKAAVKAYKTLVPARPYTAAPVAAPVRLATSASLSRRLSNMDAGISAAAAAATPAAAFAVEGPVAAAARPQVGTAAAAAAAVRTAVAAVPAAVVAAVRRAGSTSMGRRSVMVAALLLLGGLWALVADIPLTGSAVGAAVATAPAATTAAAAPAAAAPTIAVQTGTLTVTTAAPGAAAAATAAAATKAAAAAATAASSAAAAAVAAVGFNAAIPGSGIVQVGSSVVNAYLVYQGAAAVVAGYVDPSQLQQAAGPTAAECAAVPELPAAQLLCL